MKHANHDRSAGPDQVLRSAIGRQRLDFQVAAGEIVGFLGPNGAGKTTTLKILAGFWRRRGHGQDQRLRLCHRLLAVRRSLGYVPENVAIYPDLTVTQFLRFAAGPRALRPRPKPVKLSG